MTTRVEREPLPTTEELERDLDSFIRDSLSSKANLDKLSAHYRVTGLYSYSLLNQIMIIMQGGTVCNSYKRWQKMKRQVKKGERARIQILRPASRKVKEVDPKTGEEVEKWVTSARRFVTAKVFDIEQTDGEPLSFDHNSEGACTVSFEELERIGEKLGILGT